MPGKDGAVPRARTPSEPPARKFRRPSAEAIRLAALRLLRRGTIRYRSQRELREALLPILQREDPMFRLGGTRIRQTLIGIPGVRVTVRYAERNTRRPLQRCPVCFSEVRPIRNRTLYEDRVILGYRCTRCAYWTHLRRRVPVRYGFSKGEPVNTTE